MFSHFADRIKNFAAFRSDIARLRVMDDRQLEDIGLSRGSIRRAVLTGQR